MTEPTAQPPPSEGVPPVQNAASGSAGAAAYAVGPEDLFGEAPGEQLAERPSSPRRKASRAPRADRVLNPKSARLPPVEAIGLVQTPLVPSRSLGALLGLRSLSFKLESCQPTGSWLDRGVVNVLASAVGQGATGLGIVGADAVTIALAAGCARSGLRLVVLVPCRSTDNGAAEPVLPLSGWLSALGAHLLPVAASPEQIERAAPAIMATAGLWRIDRREPALQAGLADVVAEIERAGRGADLLVVSALTGGECSWLASTSIHRRAAVPLPLDTGEAALPDAPIALVGEFDPIGGPVAKVDTTGPDETGGQQVLRRLVTLREAEAARRMLAREEGLLVSAHGAAGLAALSRALHERLIPRTIAAVVVLTSEPTGPGSGPMEAADDLPRRRVSLDELQSGLGRLLVEPGGPPNG